MPALRQHTSADLLQGSLTQAIASLVMVCLVMAGDLSPAVLPAFTLALALSPPFPLAVQNLHVAVDQMTLEAVLAPPVNGFDHQAHEFA